MSEVPSLSSHLSSVALAKEDAGREQERGVLLLIDYF
jgi:hypothetical protein